MMSRAKRNLVCTAAALALLALVLVLTWPAAVEGQARPVCSDSSKSSIATLDPQGQQSTMKQVEFATPFCTGPVVVHATLLNGQAADSSLPDGQEEVKAMAWGLEAVNLSLELDYEPTQTYQVYWTAEKATQAPE
jgi:hypothetical protein